MPVAGDEPDRSAVDDWEGHWETFGAAVEANPANRYRERLIFDRLGSLEAGEHLIDIGSGQGEFALLAATRYPGLMVRGLEYSAFGVARANQRAARLGIRASFSQRDLLADVDPEPSERAWAGVAVCSEVLEHVDEPARLLRHALAYLQPGCRIVITVPGGPRSALDRHIGHRQHFNPPGLRRVLTAAGLGQIVIRRAGFPFFNLYRLTIIARGRALIGDIEDRESAATLSGGARLAIRFFERAFDLTIDDSPFGWQLVATAVAPS